MTGAVSGWLKSSISFFYQVTRSQSAAVPLPLDCFLNCISAPYLHVLEGGDVKEASGVSLWVSETPMAFTLEGWLPKLLAGSKCSRGSHLEWTGSGLGMGKQVWIKKELNQTSTQKPNLRFHFRFEKGRLSHISLSFTLFLPKKNCPLLPLLVPRFIHLLP